jgi:hypothetical protein
MFCRKASLVLYALLQVTPDSTRVFLALTDSFPADDPNVIAMSIFHLHGPVWLVATQQRYKGAQQGHLINRATRTMAAMNRSDTSAFRKGSSDKLRTKFSA